MVVTINDFNQLPRGGCIWDLELIVDSLEQFKALEAQGINRIDYDDPKQYYQKSNEPRVPDITLNAQTRPINP